MTGHDHAERNPQSAGCQDGLAEALEQSGNLPAAIQSYKKAIELLDRFPEPNEGYARYREKTATRIAELESRATKSPR